MKETQVNTFYDRVAMRFAAYPVMDRRNPYYVNRLAERCLLQLEAEEIDRYGVEIDGTGWESLKRKWRDDGTRYRSFKQRDGTIVVLAQVYDRKLPDREPDKLKLLKTWIGGMPPSGSDARIGGNRDFGKEHAGLKLEPVHPGRYIKVDYALDDISPVLSLDNISHHKVTQNGKTFIKVDGDKDEIERYVEIALKKK